MSLELFINGVRNPINWGKFPAGETNLRIENNIPDFEFYKGCSILMNFEGNDDLFNLLLLVDAVRREFGNDIEIDLNMPYLSYARQDRVCNKGEPLSVKVVTDLINSVNFNNVYCWNIHSDVGGALINNLKHGDMTEIAGILVNDFPRGTTVLVSPDAGAMKKTLAFAKEHGYPRVICAEKQRDTLTGEIKGIKIPSDAMKNIYQLGDLHFLVLDDICDGGRTFIELAKALESHILFDDSINLYVTHGIFSNGLSELQKYYTNIYTSNLMSKDETVKRGVICI